MQFPNYIINKLVLAAIWALSETQGSETGLGINDQNKRNLSRQNLLNRVRILLSSLKSIMTSLDFFHEIYQFFHALRSSGRLQHFPNDPCFSPINLFIFFKSIILDSNIEFVVGSPLCFKRNFSEFCGFSLSSKLKHFKLLFD